MVYSILHAHLIGWRGRGELAMSMHILLNWWKFKDHKSENLHWLPAGFFGTSAQQETRMQVGKLCRATGFDSHICHWNQISNSTFCATYPCKYCFETGQRAGQLLPEGTSQREQFSKVSSSTIHLSASKKRWNCQQERESAVTSAVTGLRVVCMFVWFCFQDTAPGYCPLCQLLGARECSAGKWTRRMFTS